MLERKAEQERKCMIYAGCYTPASRQDPEGKKRGIEVLEWDFENVPQRKTVLESSNPSWLLCSKDGQILYAANEEGQGCVTRFVKGKDGILAAQDSIRFPGQASCHLCLSPDEHYLFVADYTSGDLAILDCREEKLSVIQRIVYSGKGSHPIRQESPHIHSSWCLPDSWLSAQRISEGGELLVVDLGTDRLYRYLIGEEIPLTLHPVQPWIQLPIGSGPRHVTFHWEAKVAYVTAELSSQVFLIRFDEENLGHVQQTWKLADENVGNLVSHLELWPEKRMLYVAVRGADELVWFSVDEDTGELIFQGRCPSGGTYPRHFLVDRERNCLLAANQRSGRLCMFQMDETGNVLSPPVWQMEIPNVVCVLEKG